MQTFKKIVIYFFLWAFGILAFPVLLFLNWKNKDKNYKNYLVASGIGFGMFLIVLPFTDESDTASTQEVAQEEEQVEDEAEDTEEKDDEEENEAEDTEEEAEDEENEEPQEEQGLNEKIEAVANDVFDEGAVETNYFEPTDHIDVKFQMDDGLTTSMTKRFFLIDVTEFIEQIQNEDFGSIYFGGYFDMVDKYGDVENYEIANVEMNKETIDKINFENFYFKNLPDIADKVNFHPALLDS